RLVDALAPHELRGLAPRESGQLRGVDKVTETTLTWAVPPAYIFNFFLVLGRVGAVVGTAPLISGRSVPMQVKVALSVLVSLVLVAANAGRLAPVPETWSGFVAAVGLHV